MTHLLLLFADNIYISAFPGIRLFSTPPILNPSLSLHDLMEMFMLLMQSDPLVDYARALLAPANRYRDHD